MNKQTQEQKLIILVATEEEKNILLSESILNNPYITVIITGVGQKNVINAIKEYCYDAVPVVNIGLSAGTSQVPRDTLIPITAVMPGFNYGNHQQSIVLPILDARNAYPCVSAPGFITDVSQFFPESCYSHDYTVDMELYTIASFFKTVYAFKVISDDGNFDDYLSTLENYEAFSSLREKFNNIISKFIGG